MLKYPYQRISLEEVLGAFSKRKENAKMGQKDLTSKILESEPDVFADIFNTLLFTDESTRIDGKNLVSEPTEGFYYGSDGNARNVFQDIAKSYYSADEIRSHLACFNIENESQVKRTVPLKCLGYKYTTLKRQEDAYTKERNALLSLKRQAERNNETQLISAIDEKLKEMGKFQTVPFVSIVLNFDDKRWNEPTDLSELNIPSPYNQFDDSFHVRVFDVKFFDAELRAKFKSDFRVFLEMFCTDNLPDELKGITLLHPTELVDMVVAFTGNQNLKKIRNLVAVNELKGERMCMGDIFDTIAEKATEATRRTVAIQTAKRDLERGKYTTEEIISDISKTLAVSYEQAREIFEKEVVTE